ncbi:MAG: hypothetical protein KKH98_12420 [Spirochaetes bacterium]|nr:hypothetical protein [Spirochaetota bacterium]
MEKENFKKIITSHVQLKYYLQEQGLYLKKRFGQNFLFDKNIIQKIIRFIPFQDNSIIEIGPGIGNMTLFYEKIAEKAILIEIDNGLVKQLKELFKNENKITIIHADFIKHDLLPDLDKRKKYIILSNLPYSMGSQILVRALRYYTFIKEVYIMAPEIYTKKFISKANRYTDRLSLLLNLLFKIEKLFTVNKNSFFPVPKVNSAFLKLVPEKKIDNIEKTKEILALLFKQKRRKLKKVLLQSENGSKLKKYFEKRVDELSVDQVREIIDLW